MKYGSQYGPLYSGSIDLEDYQEWDNLIQNNEITSEEKEILIAMSSNEGNLDAIQSYDSEALSVGAMQKTVNSQGKGEFPIQVKEFKDAYPEKYEELFEKCGWTVETVRGKQVMYYKDPNDSSGSKVTGSQLKEKIREGFTSSTHLQKLECKPLEPIIQAAKDSDFQSKQVKDFIDRLKNKVLPMKPSGYNYRIKDYLKSKLGEATVLDHHINRPAHVRSYFSEALNQFFSKKMRKQIITIMEKKKIKK
ncbi:MAG: calcium-binding protein [Bacteroidota bacterium]